jgi:hypothetical protein
MTNAQIGRIGALGGISLALLKLIESGFFLGEILSTTAWVAYLTYGTYIFFGVVVSIYFTERTLAPEKVKKSAFIMGLLAPSVLLALTTQPLGKEELVDGGVGVPDITKLGALVVSTAHAAGPVAECPDGTIMLVGTCVKAAHLTKAQVKVTVKEALKSALGRGAPVKKYVFVVSVTSNAHSAVDAANQINSAVADYLAAGAATATVVIPEGQDILYVTVGDFTSASTALVEQKAINRAAIQILKSSTDPTARASAELLLNGTLVEDRVLLMGAPN